jgi:hypothetical protein
MVLMHFPKWEEEMSQDLEAMSKQEIWEFEKMV